MLNKIKNIFNRLFTNPIEQIVYFCVLEINREKNKRERNRTRDGSGLHKSSSYNNNIVHNKTQIIVLDRDLI